MAENGEVKKSEPQVPKNDWFQTESKVTLDIKIKGLKKEDVQIDVSRTHVKLTTKDYVYEKNLAHPIVHTDYQIKFFATKIEVVLPKAEGVRWTQLEGEGNSPLLPGGNAAAAPSTEPPKYPCSSGRDWNKITSEIEKELAEEKADGEQALNEMFQKIYADASDETKKAMNKSFSESGGTVLSTNWNEIKSKKTEIKPPDGMEYKKYDS